MNEDETMLVNQVEGWGCYLWAQARQGMMGWEQVRQVIAVDFSAMMRDHAPSRVLCTIQSLYWQATARSSLEYLEHMERRHPALRAVV